MKLSSDIYKASLQSSQLFHSLFSLSPLIQCLVILLEHQSPTIIKATQEANRKATFIIKVHLWLMSTSPKRRTHFLNQCYVVPAEFSPFDFLLLVDLPGLNNRKATLHQQFRWFAQFGLIVESFQKLSRVEKSSQEGPLLALFCSTF